MSNKTFVLDWGVYTVEILYNSEDINQWVIRYIAPGKEWHKKEYRKLSNPEKRAVIEAIYRNEQIRIPAEDPMPMTATQPQKTYQERMQELRMSRDTILARDMFARTAMDVLLTKKQPKGLFRKTVHGIAEEAYQMADAMMEARLPKKVFCKHCGQEIVGDHGC